MPRKVEASPGEKETTLEVSIAAEREGNESNGEHGSKGEGGSTGSDGGGEAGEAAMSSPIIPLAQSWNGVLGGLAVTVQYDAATQSIHGTVRNTLSEKLCYVQAEPHLKSGTKTVGELGPEKLGHLNPGQEATTSLSVASERNLQEFLSMDTSFTWKYSTAAAPALQLTQEEKVLKAAVNTALRVKAVMNPVELAAKKVAVLLP